MQFQIISILLPQKGLEFPGGSVRPKNSKKCMKLNRDFQRGGQVLKEIPSVGRYTYGYFLELHNIKEVHSKPRLHVSVNLLLGVWPPSCATLSPLLSSPSCISAHEQRR